MATPLSLEQRILIAAEYNADRVEDIKELMGEVAADFAKWIPQNAVIAEDEYYFELLKNGIRVSEEELYELYLQSNKHDNNDN